jgi:hypothetical protein
MLSIRKAAIADFFSIGTERFSLAADNIGWPRAQERAVMDYYAGLDVSMEEIH